MIEMTKGDRGHCWRVDEEVSQALFEGWVLAAEKRCLQVIDLANALRCQAAKDEQSTSFRKRSVGLVEGSRKREAANAIDEAMKL